MHSPYAHYQKLIYPVLAFIFTATLFASSAMAEENAVWRYAFRPGDNLIHFGRQHLVNPEDWKILQTLNNIKDPYRMPVGKIINVPLHMVKFQPTAVKVVSASGNCYQQDASGKQSEVIVGDELAQGTLLSTKANSQVVIRFADGSTSQLNSNASLALDTLSLYSGGAMVDTKVRLQSGQLETHANPGHQFQTNMNVQTPSAIAAVRGTKFRVSAAGDATLQETLEGGVDLSASGQVIKVAGGYGTKAKKGQPPQPPVKLLPAINTNQLPKTFKTVPVAFNLPVLKGAASWESQVANDQQFNQVVAEAATGNQTLMYGDLPDGKYHLKVRAKDRSGISGYDATHVFLVDARPFAPSVNAEMVTYKEAQPELTWEPVDDAIAYMVQVSKKGGGKDTALIEKTTEAKLKIPTPLTEGQYDWRVSAIAKLADGKVKKGLYSKVAHFQYVPPPPMPDISNLKVKVVNNRVYVLADAPIEDYQYHAVLDNPKNKQEKVWVGTQLSTKFDFLLKEYGKQALHISYIDSDGVIGPAAVYEFDAYSVW